MKGYVMSESLRDDAITALTLAVHPSISFSNVARLIQMLRQCKPVEVVEETKKGDDEV